MDPKPKPKQGQTQEENEQEFAEQLTLKGFEMDSPEEDFSVSEGLDAAWIDEVIFPTTYSQNVLINELNQNKLIVYPNPVKSILFVESENPVLNGFQLFDLYGKLIMEESSLVSQNSYQINTEKLSPGHYFIRFISNKKFVMKKLIVQK